MLQPPPAPSQLASWTKLDSGLDIDALSIVESKGHQTYHDCDGALLLDHTPQHASSRRRSIDTHVMVREIFWQEDTSAIVTSTTNSQHLRTLAASQGGERSGWVTEQGKPPA